jgi:hypothetical protein
MTIPMVDYAYSQQTAQRYIFERYMRVGVRDWQEKNDLLEYVDAHPSKPELIEIAYERLHSFLKRKHDFRVAMDLEDLIPGAPDFDFVVPFREDHVRMFQNTETGKLIYTSQPYFPAYSGTLSEEERAEYERFHIEGDYTKEHFDKEHIDVVLARLRRTVGEFAKQHNLDLEVSFEGSWYFPGKSVLIVLKQR